MKRHKSTRLGSLCLIASGLICLAQFSKAEVPPTPPEGQEQRELTEEEQAILKSRQQQAEIRKIISSEPDPSLMLEPVPEAPEDKRKKVPPKPQRPVPPGERDVASAPGGNPLANALSPTAAAPAAATVNPAAAAPAAVAGQAAAAPTGNPLLSLNPSSSGSRGLNSPKLGKLHAEAPPAPEIAIILHNKQFFPSRIRLKAGVPTKVFFTTTNDRPAAIVVEQLQVQKWLAKDNDRKPASEYDRAKFEVSREVTRNKMTEIMFEPRRGTYSVHDAITGAKGQIVVE